jgi:hypothetical protein
MGLVEHETVWSSAAEDVEAEVAGVPDESVMVGARRVDKSLDAFRTDADVDEPDVHRFSRFQGLKAMVVCSRCRSEKDRSTSHRANHRDAVEVTR